MIRGTCHLPNNGAQFGERAYKDAPRSTHVRRADNEKAQLGWDCRRRSTRDRDARLAPLGAATRHAFGRPGRCPNRGGRPAESLPPTLSPTILPVRGLLDLPGLPAGLWLRPVPVSLSVLLPIQVRVRGSRSLLARRASNKRKTPQRFSRVSGARCGREPRTLNRRCQVKPVP